MLETVQPEKAVAVLAVELAVEMVEPVEEVVVAELALLRFCQTVLQERPEIVSWDPFCGAFENESVAGGFQVDWEESNGERQ